MHRVVSNRRISARPSLFSMHAPRSARLWLLFYSSLAGAMATTYYDFIVVGGGTAGLALSTRLSELLPSASIVVMEAGVSAPSEPGINNPGLRGSTFGTQFDWKLTTVPQPHAGSRSISLPRGKVLGGSSALNFMTWDRTSRAEYDAWSDAAFGGRSSGWDWDGMFHAMLRVENFSRPTEFGVYGRQGVGFGGPIQTLINEAVPAQQLAFIPAMERLGLRNNLESLDGDPLGVMRQPSNLRARDYTRSYSIFYLPHAGHNLVIRANTSVDKINFSPHRDRMLIATGVTLDNGTILRARKEVILAAGTYLSPGVLERSGIGNSSILRQAGIATLIDLPGVGEHLQEHVRIQNSYQLKPNFTSFDKVKHNATYAAEQLALYNADLRGGAYDYTGSAYAYFTWAQANVSVARLSSLARASAQNDSPIDRKKMEYLSDARVPDVELIFSDGYTGAKGYPTQNSSLFGQGFFTLISAVMHLFAQGSVHINVSAPHALPVLDPRFLSNPYDLAAVAAAARHIRKVAETPPLKDVWVAEYEPGSAVQTDAEWKEYARKAMASIDHPTGTCAMMAHAEGGVVDAQLRVHGTKNLRVVDASIMPVQVSAHIQTSVYAIAERAAVLIAKDWAGAP